MSIFRKGPKPGYHRDSGFPAFQDTRYLDVLAAAERAIDPEWYLEIGSRTGTSLRGRKSNFIAIDPVFEINENVLNAGRRMYFIRETSDEFFASGFLEKNAITLDLAFIDGMHLFEFALRDFMNCERNASRGGCILFHDVAPFNHDMTTRDKSYLRPKVPWTGDVWKVMAILAEYRSDLASGLVLAQKTGIGFVSRLDPTNRVLAEAYDEIIGRFTDMTLQDYGLDTYFSAERVVSIPEFISIIGPAA
jgi:Methyltransferase domain